MKTIAISNQKGGVAKSTTAAAMAAALQRKGFRVLVVDADPQGNLSDSAGAELMRIENGRQVYPPTTNEVMKKEVRAEDAIQRLSAFDLIPANIMLAAIEHAFTGSSRDYKLKEALEPVKEEYDYVLIDTPPSLGVLTANALTASDEIIVPTNTGYFATVGIQQLFDTIEDNRKYSNPNIKVAGILLTRYNPRTIIGQDLKSLTEEIARHGGAPVFKTYIRSSVVVEEAQANKQDIFSYTEKNRVSPAIAEDYMAFVEEYLEGSRHG